ncbi:hypothetical protein CWR48_06460 [Oceanobacillus arenosus]|uniref:Uncharacterized protein n=1 Tax=Oceanobacillus arenosus TaxID=1229153 RepID=A0A3D8PWB5_9BACI|nr:hypothetical protein CWR48_06460 [Oceanobacillus arenosus]
MQLFDDELYWLFAPKVSTNKAVYFCYSFYLDYMLTKILNLQAPENAQGLFCCSYQNPRNG